MAAISSRLAFRLLLGAATALMLAFSLFWLFAAQQLGHYLHQPAFNGAAFVDFCATSEITGFPFRLKLTCGGLKAPLQTGGGELVFTAEEVKGAASLWSPNHAVLNFSSPVVLRSADGAFAKLRHDGAALDVAWGMDGLTEAAVQARALDWRPEAPDAGPAFNAQSLEFAARPSTRNGVRILRVEADVDGLTAPLLQSLLGNPAPSALSLAGDLYPLLTPHENWRAALEDWRKAKGLARIERGDWRWGTLTASFAGVLALDDARRLVGTIDIDARGAGALAARLGLPVAPGAAGALLRALLGGKPPPQDKPQDDSIAMTLRLTDGAAFLGPLKIGTLAPLY
jgi:hypothetical protein